MTFFRAVALDLDGTLAVADRIAPEVIEAIDRARPGHAVALVTGRVLQDLDRGFPGLTNHFDAVVSENGAVLTTGTATRDLHDPIDRSVDHALADRGVAFQRGRVLVAIAGRDGGIAVDAIAGIGLDYQVAHNRGAAMILPSGVTKGTGLHAALETLGLSEHNAIAVGDAENDLSLLHAAEVGAAVANAVPSLAEHADLMLDQPDGQGVIELLRGPLLAGTARLCPPRHWVPIGVYDDGAPARIPGSQAGILVMGDTGSGKSYVAGLLAERWIEAGYSVLVIDPEGDHLGLSERSGVHLVDATAGLPTPHDLLALLRPGHVSVVLDLSGVAADEQLRYLQRLPDAIAAERAGHGRPHWVIYDEAHQQAWLDQSRQVAAGPGGCLVTWRPELLPEGLARGADVVITTAEPGATSGERATATLTTAGETRTFRVDKRISSHVRHQHKYAAAPLPPHRRFYFRDQDPTSAAATVEEFRNRISHADSAILDYHLGRGDFSRWVSGTLADGAFADELARIEREMTDRHAAAVEHAREEICRAIEQRYLRA